MLVGVGYLELNYKLNIIVNVHITSLSSTSLHRNHVNSIDGDTRAQVSGRSLTRDDTNLQHLVLRSLLDPSRLRYSVLIDIVVTAVRAHGQRPGTCLALVSLKRCGPAVHGNGRASTSHAFSNAKADFCALFQLGGGELEVHEVVVVDVFPDVAGEVGGLGVADDEVGCVPFGEAGIGWVHVGWLHGGVDEVEEALWSA